MGEAIRAVYGNYAGFAGRAARPEYWWYTLFFLIVYLGGLAVAGVTGSTLVQLLVLAFVLGSLVPSIAVTVRRLHDTGQSGWLYLVALVPVLGLVIVYFLVQPTDPGANQYGPPPGGGPAGPSVQGPHSGPFTG